MNNHLIGVISLNAKGKGFVRIEGREDDVPVEPEDISTALPGDTVEIETYKGFRGAEYGNVLKVVERRKTQFVGTIFKSNSLENHPEEIESEYVLIPDDRRSNVTIQIVAAEDPNVSVATDLKPELKAAVRIDTDSWIDTGKGPVPRTPNGFLVKIIGEKGNNNAEMEAIVLERGFDTTFDQNVVDEAEEAAREYGAITEEELSKRRDMRGVFTCTIDPVDAKDFDDALSIRPLTGAEAETEDGVADYEVGVHIADVAHYVRPGTALDNEAKKRAFSVYLVDRTIPMLPSVLSNGMCSLNPNEDRFAFSTIFKMKKDGTILDRWFGRTIIHSDKRLAYEDAQDILNKVAAGEIQVNPEDASAWHQAPFAVELTEFNRLAKTMLAERKKKGAIDFESTEIKFKLDEEGRPIAVYKKERLDAHKLIEEFMLLSNREVAEYISRKNKEAKQEKSGVYRTHDLPDHERLQDLGIFVRALGFDFTPTKKIGPKDIQALLTQVEGSPAEAVIKIATLRSMAKATYSTLNTGHFGLAFEYYTQFTSPIRRYPDLMVHRILAIILEGKNVPAHMAATLEKICIDSSRREIEAADAERASVKYKQVEFMQSKVGQTFDAMVSGIADWGMYVEEPEAKAEGLIRLKDLKPDDFYSVDQKNYKIVGQNTKTEFHIGQPVKVKLLNADLDNKMLDFQLIV